MGAMNNKQNQAGAVGMATDPTGGLGAASIYGLAGQQQNGNLSEKNFWKINDPLNVSGQNPSLGPTGGGPKQANIQQGTTVNDVRGAQNNAGNNMASQQALLQALQSQNGMGVQNSAVSGLQGASSMYGDIAQGRGPNVAQSMLNQQTGQNVANQAALMAGQRGAGANTGLMARQAAQQGAATQQQAVGQGATMQAQQQQNALAGMVNAQGAIGNLGNTMAGQQIGQVNANTQAALSNQQMMQNSLAGINNANVASQGSVNTGNVALAQQAQAARAGLLGGILNAGGAAMGAEGGEVMMATGGDPLMQQPMAPAPVIQNVAAPQMMPQESGPSSSFGQFLNQQPASQDIIEPEEKKKGGKKSGLDIGKVATIAMMAAEGGLADAGGHVQADAPSEKAVASGNDYANDKIDAKLSEGEIVLPRSVTMSEDPAKAAAEFVSKTLADRKAKPKTMYADAGEVIAPAEEMAPVQQPEVATTAPMPPVQQQAAPVAATVQIPDVDSETKQTLDEQIKINQDIASGKITPATYHSLFAKKDTLGKIGTVFGLLLSGAGSGLSKQPNMLLHMMDKQIDQDLEAQKANKDNARSFLSTISENRKRRADQAETEMRVLNEGVKGAKEAKIAEQVMGGMKGGAFFKKYTDDQQKILDGLEAKPPMIDATVDHLRKASSGNPTSQAVIDNHIAPAAEALKAQTNDKLIGTKKLFDAQNSKNPMLGRKPHDALPGHDERPPVVDQSKLNNLLFLGKNAPEMKGAIPVGEQPAVNQEVQDLTLNRNGAYDWNDSFNKMAQLKNAGETPLTSVATGAGAGLGSLFGAPGVAFGSAIGHAVGGVGKKAFERERAIQKEALKQRIGKNMSEDAKEELVDSMLPSWTDTDGSMAEAHRKGVQHFSSLEAPTLLKQYGLYSKFPDLPFNKRDKVRAADPNEKAKPKGKK